MNKETLTNIAGKAFAAASVVALGAAGLGVVQHFNPAAAGDYIPHISMICSTGAYIAAAVAGKVGSIFASNSRSGLANSFESSINLDGQSSPQRIPYSKAVTSFGYDRYKAQGQAFADMTSFAIHAAVAPPYLSVKSVYDNFLRPK